MLRRTLPFCLALLCAGCGGSGGAFVPGGSETPVRLRTVPFASAAFSAPGIDNPWLPLRPGTTFVYQAGTGAQRVVEVTYERREILSVACVAVHDVTTEGAVVREDAIAYYAQDDAAHVWCLGRTRVLIDERGSPSTTGSWIAGLDGAEPVLAMLADPVPGDRYAGCLTNADQALDVEVVADEVEVATPLRAFPDCLVLHAPAGAPTDLPIEVAHARHVGVVRTTAGDGPPFALVALRYEPRFDPGEFDPVPGARR